MDKKKEIVLMVFFAAAAWFVVSSMHEKIEIIETPSTTLIEEVASVSDVIVATKPKAVIIMHSRDNCPPCDSWWAVERTKWEAVGWSIEKQIDNNDRKLTPWFEIHDADGDVFNVNGYMTGETFKKAKAGAK